MNTRYLALIAASLVPLVILALLDPIPQDLSYHNFTDKKEILSINNFWNVISNLLYVFFGIYGLSETRKLTKIIEFNYAILGFVFFIGLTLSGLGSAYYHLSPSNDTLVWDRLPMTFAFMAFFSTILTLHFPLQKQCLTILASLILIGIASVIYWNVTENLGRGDLRPYAAVQFLPMVLIPAIVLLFNTNQYHVQYVGWIIGVYVIAKITEYFDGEIQNLISFSGHSIKHLTSAFAGIYYLKLMQSIQIKPADKSSE